MVTMGDDCGRGSVPLLAVSDQPGRNSYNQCVGGGFPACHRSLWGIGWVCNLVGWAFKVLTPRYSES